jgi:hypothetical protein
MLHHSRSQSFQLTRVEHGVICSFFRFSSLKGVALAPHRSPRKNPQRPSLQKLNKQTTMEQRKDEWEQEQIKVRGGLLALLCLLFFFAFLVGNRELPHLMTAKAR